MSFETRLTQAAALFVTLPYCVNGEPEQMAEETNVATKMSTDSDRTNFRVILSCAIIFVTLAIVGVIYCTLCRKQRARDQTAVLDQDAIRQHHKKAHRQRTKKLKSFEVHEDDLEPGETMNARSVTTVEEQTRRKRKTTITTKQNGISQVKARESKDPKKDNLDWARQDNSPGASQRSCASPFTQKEEVGL